MTILVTGATGTVGSEVVARLAAAGARVRAASRRPGASPGRHGVESIAMDLRDPAGVAAALAGVERVFLLTPLEEDMVEHASRFVAAAADAGVRRFVRLSAFGAGDACPNTLGRTHRAVERVVESSGLEWTVLRPNGFMQNFVTQHGADIRARGAFASPQGQGRVSHVDVCDVADVAVAALTGDGHAGRTYDLTGPEALSNAEIAALLAGTLGREIHHEEVTPEATRALLESFGVPAWIAGVVLELYAMSAEGGAARVSPDVARVLGRAPIAFGEFAADHRAAFEHA